MEYEALHIPAHVLGVCGPVWLWSHFKVLHGVLTITTHSSTCTGCVWPCLAQSGCDHILGSCMEYASAGQLTAIESSDPLCSMAGPAAGHARAVRMRHYHAMQVDKCDSICRLCTEARDSLHINVLASL